VTGSAGAGGVPPVPDLASLGIKIDPVDLFRGVIRLEFGERQYEMPALTIAEDEVWKASLDQTHAALLGAVQDGGEDSGAILLALMGATDQLLDSVYAYDKHGVLPPREELRATARSIDPFRACMTIWVSTNPTLATGLAKVEAVAKLRTNGTSRASTRGRSRTGARRRQRSGAG